MSLGTSLAQARRKAGLTQEAVAEKLGVSPADDQQMGVGRNAAGHSSVKTAGDALSRDAGRADRF